MNCLLRVALPIVLLTCLAAAADTRPAAVRIMLAGDSTVTDKVGWGNGFAAAVSDGVEVRNLSKAGRSTKSFVDEGWWEQVLADRADYVLIQFGHNDQKPDAARHTDPDTTYRQYLTRFVREARGAGIRPILVTSLSRRDWGPDGKIHSTLIPYAAAVRAVAEQMDVPLIDLHDRSIALYERVGKAETDAMSPVLKTGLDNTHLNAHGSSVIGWLVADELAKAVPALAPYVKVK